MSYETALDGLGGKHAGDISSVFFPGRKSPRVSFSTLSRADHTDGKILEKQTILRQAILKFIAPVQKAMPDI